MLIHRLAKINQVKFGLRCGVKALPSGEKNLPLEWVGEKKKNAIVQCGGRSRKERVKKTELRIALTEL